MLVIQPREGSLGAHFPVFGDKCVVLAFFQGLEPEFGFLLNVMFECLVDPKGPRKVSLKIENQLGSHSMYM